MLHDFIKNFRSVGLFRDEPTDIPPGMPGLDSGHQVHGPGHLWARDILLSRLQEKLFPYRRLCLSLVFGPGGSESENSGTKIGGLPYWPTEAEWPVDSRGQPLSYLAQIAIMGNMSYLDPSFPFDFVTIHCTDDPWDDTEGRADSDQIRLTVFEDKPFVEQIDYAEMIRRQGRRQTEGPYYAEGVCAYDFLLPPDSFADLSLGKTILPDDLIIVGAKIGGYVPMLGDYADQYFRDMKKPVFLFSLSEFEIPKGHEACFLPRVGMAAPTLPPRFELGNNSMLVVCFEEDDPLDLHWALYNP